MSFLLKTRRFQSTAARLRNIILLVKDVQVSAHFYRTAIGVPVIGQTDEMVQLDTGGTSVILKVQFHSSCCHDDVKIMQREIISNESCTDGISYRGQILQKSRH